MVEAGGVEPPSESDLAIASTCLTGTTEAILHQPVFTAQTSVILCFALWVVLTVTPKTSSLLSYPKVTLLLQERSPLWETELPYRLF